MTHREFAMCCLVGSFWGLCALGGYIAAGLLY